MKNIQKAGFALSAVLVLISPLALAKHNTTIVINQNNPKAPVVQVVNGPRGDADWVSAQNGYIPRHTKVLDHANGNDLIACRARFENTGMHPGTLVSSGCLITYAGRAYVMPKYQVLSDRSNTEWRPSFYLTRNYSDRQGPSPVIGGHEEGHPIYVCKTRSWGQVGIGKVVGDGCNIAVGNDEHAERNFEVLYYN